MEGFRQAGFADGLNSGTQLLNEYKGLVRMRKR